MEPGAVCFTNGAPLQASLDFQGRADTTQREAVWSSWEPDSKQPAPHLDPEPVEHASDVSAGSCASRLLLSDRSRLGIQLLELLQEPGLCHWSFENCSEEQGRMGVVRRRDSTAPAHLTCHSGLSLWSHASMIYVQSLQLLDHTSSRGPGSLLTCMWWPKQV